MGEAGDWELVLTGQDGGLVGACEDAVYAQGMQLLLLQSRCQQLEKVHSMLSKGILGVTYVYHRGECVYDIFSVQWCDGCSVVAGDTFGDIGEQLGEIGDLE